MLKFKFKYLFCLTLFSILLFSCGPSAEERKKRKEAYQKEKKEKERVAILISEKYRSIANDYRRRLRELKNILVESDTLKIYGGSLNPGLKTHSASFRDKEEINVLTISFEALSDLNKDLYGDVFDIFPRRDAFDALEIFQKIDEGKISEVYYFSEKMAVTLNTQITPYVLVMKRASIAPVVIKDKESYTGGETKGYAWLVDLREMKLLGSIGFEAVPGSVYLKEGELRNIESSAKSGSNRQVQVIIKRWLDNFK